MKLAYLINTYPSPSHSFVRREIAALEAGGATVQRIALRRADVSHAEDVAEARRTRYVLDVGAGALPLVLIQMLFTRPAKMVDSLALAIRVGRRSDVGVFKYLVYLAEACVLLRWLMQDGTQHVHAHFGTNSTAVAMLCRTLGGPTYSFTAHGPEEFDKPQALGIADKIQRASFVVAVCSFGRSQLYRWCSREQWDKIQVVHCGVDDLFLTESDQPITTAPNLLQVGRLSEQKGQLLLIDAARQLVDRGIEFHLTLVGGGELRDELERQIKQHRLHNCVTLAGWKTGTEIRQMMLDSRALVMPSFAEGLPVVLMESLALKRPVISTYVAGIPELVGEGVCGWLVPAGDSVALADAMATVLAASTEKLNQFGIAGRQRVLEHHNASTEASHLASLFRNAIANTDRAPIADVSVQLNHAV